MSEKSEDEGMTQKQAIKAAASVAKRRGRDMTLYFDAENEHYHVVPAYMKAPNDNAKPLGVIRHNKIPD